VGCQIRSCDHAWWILSGVAAKDYTKTFTVGRQLLEQEPKTSRSSCNWSMPDYSMPERVIRVWTPNHSLARKTLQLVDSNKVTDPHQWPALPTFAASLILVWARVGNDCAAEAKRLTASDQRGGCLQDDLQLTSCWEPRFTTPSINHWLRNTARNTRAKMRRRKARQCWSEPTRIGSRAIDAMARAVALAPDRSIRTEGQVARAVDRYLQDFHNNSDAGLNELVATVLSKPLP